jgi:hypothetical protein
MDLGSTDGVVFVPISSVSLIKVKHDHLLKWWGAVLDHFLGYLLKGAFKCLKIALTCPPHVQTSYIIQRPKRCLGTVDTVVTALEVVPLEGSITDRCVSVHQGYTGCDPCLVVSKQERAWPGRRTQSCRTIRSGFVAGFWSRDETPTLSYLMEKCLVWHLFLLKMSFSPN